MIIKLLASLDTHAGPTNSRSNKCVSICPVKISSNGHRMGTIPVKTICLLWKHLHLPPI